MATKSPAEKKKQRRSMLISLLIVAATVGGVLIFVYMFPRVFHSQRLVETLAVSTDGREYLVSVYMETGEDEDDGTYLAGYEIRTADPLTGKELHKLYIERFADGYPDLPRITFSSNSRLWIIHPSANFGSGTNYLARIIVYSDGTMAHEQIPALADYSIGNPVENLRVHVRNKYNEAACFDFLTGEITEGECIYPKETETGKQVFFFVPISPGSTRSKMYHLSVSPEAAAFDPYKYPGGKAYSRDLYNRIQSSYSNTFNQPEELQRFLTGLPSSEGKLIPLLSDTPLLNASLLYSDSSTALVRSGEASDTELTLFCVTSGGETLWNYRRPAPKGAGSIPMIKAIRFRTLTVLECKDEFMVALDNATGKVIWEQKR